MGFLGGVVKYVFNNLHRFINWDLSTARGGKCPSGHFKSLNLYWSPGED
jgi:hypothetical protein